MQLSDISERYQKVLVTVSMGFRTEEDVVKNGLHIFHKTDKDKCVSFVKDLFEIKSNVLALKIKPTGFRSEHINIKTIEDLESFVFNIDSIFDEKNEIWVVESSAKECWRCRLYLGDDIVNFDRFEMAYSINDHILDELQNDFSNKETPYVRYKKDGKNSRFVIEKSNLNEQLKIKTNSIFEDVYSKFNVQIKQAKKDLQFLGLNGISLDIRVNEGYDFHDFDVGYLDVKKVIEFYVIPYLKMK